MNEFNLLEVFHDEMKARGTTYDTVFLNVDDDMLGILQHKLNTRFELTQVQKLADICIANGWIERTTADPNYNFLSLTQAGLDIAIMHEYKKQL